MSKNNAKAGAKLLDEAVMHWWYDIDITTLEMADSKRCILGQLFGHCDYGLELLDEICGHTVQLDDCGFSLTSFRTQTWDELKNLWIDEIQLRRSGDEK